MYSRKVKFTNLNNVEVDQTLHFNYTRPELIRLAASYGVDIEQRLTELATSGQFGEILTTLEDLILNAYGIPSLDGNNFDKSPEIRRNFENSLAYAQLFEDLVIKSKGMEEFAKGVLSGIAELTEEELASANASTPTFEVVKAPETNPADLLQALQNDPVLMAQLSKKLEEGK